MRLGKLGTVVVVALALSSAPPSAPASVSSPTTSRSTCRPANPSGADAARIEWRRRASLPRGHCFSGRCRGATDEHGISKRKGCPLSDDLLYELRDGIARVTFNRPQARNALTFDMYERLAAICAEVDKDRSVRAMLLTGAGDKAFAAGT